MVTGDEKRGFAVAATTMESTDQGGIYAAGTTSSYVLGNTYFGPGATLGWALHSGRLAGSAAGTRASKQKSDDEKAAETQKLKNHLKHPWRITMFRAGVWLLLVAVGVHVDSRIASMVPFLKRFAAALRKAHYVLAFSAAIILLVPAISAMTQPKDERIMASSKSRELKLHRQLGHVVVVLLALQVILGIVAAMKNSNGTSSAALGVVHRVNGWIIIFSAAGLYYSSRNAATLHDDNTSKKEHHGQATAYAWVTIVTFASVLVVFVIGWTRRGFWNELLGWSWRRKPKDTKGDMLTPFL